MNADEHRFEGNPYSVKVESKIVFYATGFTLEFYLR